MSILIKGMEMPTNCYRCMFFRNTTEWDKDDNANILFRCVRTGEETWDYKGGYLPDCPLVPVPPHGDLIDADALLKKCEFVCTDDDEDIRAVRYSIIDDAPTIIPAESAEDGGT